MVRVKLLRPQLIANTKLLCCLLGFESTDLLAGAISATVAGAGQSNTLNSSRGHHHQNHQNHHHNHHHHLPMMGRITGSASIETLVRVGLEKEHGLSPDSKMLVLHDFTPLVDDELEVHRGQVVNILYQENDWVYVLSEARAANEGEGEGGGGGGGQVVEEGFIPFSYCAPYEALTFKRKMPRSGPGSVVSGLGGGGGKGGDKNNGSGGSCIEMLPFNEMPVDVGGCDLTAEVTACSMRPPPLLKRQQQPQPDSTHSQHFYDDDGGGGGGPSSSLGRAVATGSGTVMAPMPTMTTITATAKPSTGNGGGEGGKGGGSFSALPGDTVAEASTVVSASCSNGHLGGSNISSSLHQNSQPFGGSHSQHQHHHHQHHHRDINGNINGLPINFLQLSSPKMATYHGEEITSNLNIINNNNNIINNNNNNDNIDRRQYSAFCEHLQSADLHNHNLFGGEGQFTGVSLEGLKLRLLTVYILG